MLLNSDFPEKDLFIVNIIGFAYQQLICNAVKGEMMQNAQRKSLESCGAVLGCAGFGFR